MDKNLVLCLFDRAHSQPGIEGTLQPEGFECIFATCHDPVRTMLVSLPFSLILIDCSGSPAESKDACRRMRRQTTLPILLLAEPANTQELLGYLNAGANDYIIKPFKPEELLARMFALLQHAAKRTPDETLQVLRCCDLVIDVTSQRVLRDGSPIEVSPIGYRLLVYLMQHTGEVVTKQQLLRDVWGYAHTVGDMNMVDSAIQRLRKDLGDNPRTPRYIHTVWGSGYRFDRECES